MCLPYYKLLIAPVSLSTMLLFKRSGTLHFLQLSLEAELSVSLESLRQLEHFSTLLSISISSFCFNLHVSRAAIFRRFSN